MRQPGILARPFLVNHARSWYSALRFDSFLVSPSRPPQHPRCLRLRVTGVPCRNERAVGARDRVGGCIRFAEVAAHGFERILLCVDLLTRPYAQTPEDGHGRTPALQGVLEQEGRHDARQPEPSPVDDGAQQLAAAGEALARELLEDARAGMLRLTRPGSVLVLHDNPKAEHCLPFALETYLSRLTRSGWSFPLLASEHARIP